MQLRAGDPETIGGYPLEARLGAGGMGTVYLAHTASGRPVAIKLIHRQYSDDEEFRTRFRQEVAAARRVSGAFTAAVVDADPESVHPWMATTYIAGPTLAQRIADSGAVGGAELRTLAIGLTEALRDIHRAGVVHRDLKPSNVVLSSEGPRVIDFGISRAADHQTLTMTGRVIGTPPFMSPEQLQAPRDVGPESDVFSLATLLVYAATGQGPFDADSPYMTAYQVVHEEPVLESVPDLLRAIVEPCLAKERDGRPTPDELLEQLRALPETLPVPAVAQGAHGDAHTQRLSARTSGTSGKSPGEPSARAVGKGTQGRGGSTLAEDAAARHGLDSAGRAFTARGLRGRWRTVLAVVAAVAAIGTGITVLSSADGGHPSADDGRKAGRGEVAAAAAPLPKGFRTWQTTVRGGQGIPDELRCVPRGDSVYCGGGGVLATRLRVSDGKQLWRRTSPGVPVQGVHFVGVSGKTVLGYRIPADDSAAEEVVGLSADSGKELWKAPADSRSAVFTGQSYDAVLLGSTLLTAGTSRTGIEARRTGDGSLRWSTDFPSGSRCIPVGAGSRAYAMCAPRAEADAAEVRHASFHTLDLRTGTLGKAVRVDGALRVMGAGADGSLILLEEHIEGTGYDGYDKVIRLDPRTGQVSPSPVARHSDSTPGLAGGVLYFAADDGLISAVDPATGREKWATRTSVESASGPVLSDGVLYFGSASGRIAALSASGGKLRWSTNPRAHRADGEVGASSRVRVSGGALIATASENTVFAFDTAKPPKAK